MFLHYCFKERKHGGHGGLKFGSLAGLMKGLVRFRLGLVSHMMEKDAKRSLESGERERERERGNEGVEQYLRGKVWGRF